MEIHKHIRMAGGLAPLVAAAIALLPVTASAQAPLGTFRWQLEPHCNIVSVTVTPSGNVFRLDGNDDQCGGGGDLASTVGTAFLNPDGTAGIGLNIVSTPGGAPVHVDAAISVATLNGTWRDSAGNTGNFTFRAGAGSGGTPRPVSGTIGAVSVNPTQVQLRIGGSCASGSFMQSVEQNGTVSCGTGAGDITAVSAGAGLAGGGSSGAVTLSLPTTPSGAFLFTNSSGFAAVGTGGGSIPVSGAGRRAMWHATKSAFRAGNVNGTQWDDANIGLNSVAFGINTRAIGSETVAMGFQSSAIGQSAVAMGENTTASGAHAFAMGDQAVAAGGNSVALGALASATAFEAVAMGLRVTAGGNGSIVLGSDAVAIAAATGAIILSDRSTTTDFVGFAPNEFLVRAAGGTGIYSNAALTAGVTLAPGASAWAAISDVNMKENFRDLDDGDVLSKLARMPIREWNYKAQDSAIRHVGPTAQDFTAAFGLGEDPLRISTIDADGIALRAIQALEARTRELMQENAELKARLARLEAKQP